MLGHSAAAFGQLVKGCRNWGDRAALLDQVEAAHVSVINSASATDEQKRRATAIYHERLLEFVRVPVMSRVAGDRARLDFSQKIACHRLARARCRELPRVLKAWRASAHPPVQHAAAECLGYCAFDDTIEDVVQLIASMDWRVAVHTIYGAGLAAFHKHATAKFRKAVFDAAIPIVTGQHPPPRGSEPIDEPHYIEAFVRLDRRRAISLLRSKRCISHRNPALRAVAWGLHPAQLVHDGHRAVVVDPSVLWAAFDPIESERSTRLRADSERDFAIGCLLVLGATSDPERTRRIAASIRRELGAESSPLRDFCSEAIQRSRRVPAPDDAMRWSEAHPGVLEAAHEQVLVAHALANHVNNDGLPSFIDDRGHDMGRAITGLRRLKLRAAESILKAAVECRVRHATFVGTRQVVDDTSKAASEMQELEASFDRQLDRIWSAVERYLARHADDFAVMFFQPKR